MKIKKALDIKRGKRSVDGTHVPIQDQSELLKTGLRPFVFKATVILSQKQEVSK